MHSILLVEDQSDTQLLVKQIFKSDEQEVMVATDYVQATALMGQHHFALIFLDIGLPDKDGFTLCSLLQSNAKTKDIPIIILTSHEDIAHKITAFSLGADDYITKPFHPMELQARANAKIKKFLNSQRSLEVFIRGNLKINIPARRAFLISAAAEIDICLSPIEFKLLLFLAKNENRVHSREQLLDAVWGLGTDHSDRSVDAHICGLRRKLGPLATHIQSVKGIGYIFSSQSADLKA